MLENYIKKNSNKTGKEISRIEFFLTFNIKTVKRRESARGWYVFGPKIRPTYAIVVFFDFPQNKSFYLREKYAATIFTEFLLLKHKFEQSKNIILKYLSHK